MIISPTTPFALTGVLTPYFGKNRHKASPPPPRPSHAQQPVGRVNGAHAKKRNNSISTARLGNEVHRLHSTAAALYHSIMNQVTARRFFERGSKNDITLIKGSAGQWLAKSPRKDVKNIGSLTQRNAQKKPKNGPLNLKTIEKGTFAALPGSPQFQLGDVLIMRRLYGVALGAARLGWLQRADEKNVYSGITSRQRQCHLQRLERLIRRLAKLDQSHFNQLAYDLKRIENQHGLFDCKANNIVFDGKAKPSNKIRRWALQIVDTHPRALISRIRHKMSSDNDLMSALCALLDTRYLELAATPKQRENFVAQNQGAMRTIVFKACIAATKAKLPFYRDKPKNTDFRDIARKPATVLRLCGLPTTPDFIGKLEEATSALNSSNLHHIRLHDDELHHTHTNPVTHGLKATTLADQAFIQATREIQDLIFQPQH